MSAQPDPQRPVCYRHPDRETYVRCGRCERYICPDDMISAAVGFQCPECVREGNKGVRTPRTVAGGTIRTDAGAVTVAIIAINIVLFLAVQSSDEVLDRLVLRTFTFDDDGVAQGGWHRLLTATFLHEQTFHIAMNMLVLFLFGRPLEALLGRTRFIVTYLVCALGGSTASYVFSDYQVGSLGASGAVFGVIGTLLVVERRLGQNPSAALIYVGIILLPGLVIDNIDWWGHVGGLATGAALGTLYAYGPRQRRALLHYGVAAVLTGALLLAVQARTENIKDQLRDGRATGDSAPVATTAIHSVDTDCGELHGCHFARSGRFGASSPALPRA